MIPSPEYKRLMQTLEQLRIELSMLVEERDELIYVVCRNIKTQYLLKFGSLEFQVYEAECEYLRLKRKRELIVISRNRQEQVDLKQVEEVLEREFHQYQTILEEKINEMNDALQHGKSEVLTQAENKELKQMYHRIVKALHPDFHPQQTENRKIMFYHAVEAYQNGNLETLRIISTMVGDDDSGLSQQNTMMELQDEQQRLQKLLDAVRQRIGEIKQVYPYTLKERLENEQQAEQYQTELNEALSSYQMHSERLKREIEELMR